MVALEATVFSAAVSMSRAMIVTDHRGRDDPIVFVNAGFTSMTGYSSAEVIGKDCRFLQGPATDAETVRNIRTAIEAGRSIRCELLNYRKDGTAFWNDVTIDPMRDAAGNVTGYVGVQYDCTALRDAADARRTAEDRLKAIVDGVPGFVYQRVMRPSGEILYTYMSGSIAGILGLPGDIDDLPGRAMQRVHGDDRRRLGPLIVESARNLTPLLSEFRFVSVSGEEHWFRSEAAPRKADNGDIVWDGIAVEITAEKLSEAKLAHLVFHDPLTGLSNRLLFGNTLTRTVSSLEATEGQIGVFSIDLDTFQAVNDSLGGVIGDKVLRRIGLRLRECAEPKGGMVARLGGDEFAVLLPELPASDSGLEFAETICAEISRPMVVDGEQSVVEASVGAAVLPHLSDSSQAAAAEEWGAELLNRANIALLAAKRDGPGVCRLYSAEFDDRLRLRPELRKSLGRAIIEEQFTLHYQPIVDLASGAVVGAEALVRWEHPELGLQRPDLFIPIAEASGLIVPLGAWVVKAAMRQAQAWIAEGLPPLRISVNVSGIQLQKPGFLAMVDEALAETGADARQFEFELTEGFLLHASRETKSLFEALRARGFGLVIDDFGTGHSTFAYLRDYAVDKLKIDQVFIRHLVIDSSDAAIIRAILALCRNLGLAVVAEGIETVLQRNFLMKEGCTLGQGYLFSMPLPAEDFGWLLTGGITLPVQPGQAPGRAIADSGATL